MSGERQHGSVLSPEAAKQVRALIEEYSNDTAKVVPVQQRLETILKKEKVAVRRRLLPHQVVAHIKNRDEQMLTASGVELRAVRLQKVGFARQVMEQGAWCFEDNPITKHLAKAGISHYAKDPRFAIYRESDVVGGSVGASHTNHVLASVEDERPCSNVAIALNGRYNKSEWFANPEFKESCERGVDWWCIKWEIDEEHPMIAVIFQSALNTQQHVAEGEYVFVMKTFPI